MVIKLIKLSFFILFIAVSTILDAQKKTDTNFIDAKGRRQGVWKKIDTTGLSYIGQFKDNKPFGRFTYFDKHGKTITISDFFRDGFATKTTHYYPNGKMKASGFYLDKLRDSVWQFYDTLGHIIKEEHYLHGMLHGLAKTFDKSGQCVETQEWFRDLRNGLWWQKTDAGTQTTTYKLNKSHGAYEAYFPDEKPSIKIKGQYRDGLKEGIWYFFHDDHTLDRVILFENNQPKKKQVAINVNGKNIIINTDSVVYIHTNGKIVELKMLNDTIYRPSQSFEKLVKSFDLDNFFLATPRFLAAYNQFESLTILPDEEEVKSVELPERFDAVNEKKPQKAILKLKKPTPYEIVVNEEVIELLQNIPSSKPIEEF